MMKTPTNRTIVANNELNRLNKKRIVSKNNLLNLQRQFVRMCDYDENNAIDENNGDQHYLYCTPEKLSMSFLEPPAINRKKKQVDVYDENQETNVNKRLFSTESYFSSENLFENSTKIRDFNKKYGPYHSIL